MKVKWRNVFALLIIAGLVGNAIADIRWDGSTGDTLWRTGANWDLNRVPAVSDGAVWINDQTAGPLVVVDSSTNVSIDCDIFGPEWGMQVDVDGGNLTTTGWSFAPVGDVANPSIINVRNGGNLTAQNLLLGDNWWFWTAPGVVFNVYDTSTVTVNDYIWLGGKMNLYGGIVNVVNGFNMNANLQNNAHLDIEGGSLILAFGDVTEAINTWIANGELSAYGLTPGRGADIIIDTQSIIGSTVVTAVYNYPATNPTPADESTGVGTLVANNLVDVDLGWWCGADPNNPVNPNIVKHYIYMTDGSDTDPNLYYTGVSVDQISDTDPNNSYLMEDLSENTVYQWSIVEGLDAGAGTPYAVGDPNNIMGPIWSFATKAAQPVLTGPANDVADPDGTFIVVDENGAASSYQWHHIDNDGTDTALTDTGAYSGTQTDTLTVTNASLSEEGYYYCIASNGPSSDTSVSGYLWTQRLMGHWKFEQNMQDSVTDTVANAPTHDGTIDGDGPGDDNYAVAGGPDGSDAMEFNDDGDVVVIGGDPNFFNFYPLGFTVNFWYKQDAPIASDAWRLPLSKVYGASGWLFGIDELSREWALFNTSPDDTEDVALYWADGYIDVDDDGNNDINIGDGGWHMISAVYDPASTTYTIYTDGDENESIVRDLSALALPENPLMIGGILGSNSVDGFIDDVRIYSEVKTPLDIANLYIAFATSDWVCVEDPDNPLNGYDLTHDCRVNIADFAELAAKWLDCQRIPEGSCGW